MGPQLWAADFKLGKVVRRSTKTIAGRPDYYKLGGVRGQDHTIEEGLSRVEKVAAPLILGIRNGSIIPNDTQRADFSNFIALLVTRTPGWRNDTEEVIGRVAAATVRVAARHPAYFARTIREANKAKKFTNEEIEQMRQEALEPDAFEYRGTPSASLGFMLSAAQGIAPIIFSMQWRFAVPPIGARFITSDNPVFWRDPSALGFLADGLASRGTILTFPLGPEVALVARGQADGPPYAHVDQAFVDFVNRRIVRTAESCVYASRRADADDALARRWEISSRGEPVGPRRSNTFVLEDMSSD
jgi:hypothetical protein